MLPSSLRDAALRARIEAAQAAFAARRRMIIALRLIVLVVVLGGWEIAARLKWIDPFFYSMPSVICDQLVEWMRDGTSQGPLWKQVWVTLEETVIGFLIGSVAGVLLGVVARAATGCCRTSSPSTSRSPTRSRASCWARSS